MLLIVLLPNAAHHAACTGDARQVGMQLLHVMATHNVQQAVGASLQSLRDNNMHQKMRVLALEPNPRTNSTTSP